MRKTVREQRMRFACFALFAGFAALLASFGMPLAATQSGAVLLEVEGAIGPATAAYIEDGVEEAAERGAAIVILRMDTPGGLDTSMRDIIRDILSSEIPVASYVGPSGARAASARDGAMPRRPAKVASCMFEP